MELTLSAGTTHRFGWDTGRCECGTTRRQVANDPRKASCPLAACRLVALTEDELKDFRIKQAEYERTGKMGIRPVKNIYGGECPGCRVPDGDFHAAVCEEPENDRYWAVVEDRKREEDGLTDIKVRHMGLAEVPVEGVELPADSKYIRTPGMRPNPYPFCVNCKHCKTPEEVPDTTYMFDGLICIGSFDPVTGDEMKYSCRAARLDINAVCGVEGRLFEAKEA